MEMLRSRLMELELETTTHSNVTDHERDCQGLNVSADSDQLYRLRSGSSNDTEDMERNLAMLTAQYEKTRQEEDSLQLSPGHPPLAPPKHQRSTQISLLYTNTGKFRPFNTFP